MPGDAFNTVVSGQPLVIPAEAYNAFIQAALAEINRRAALERKWDPLAPQRTIIPVKNNTGSDRERFDVAAVSQPIFDVTDDEGKERPATLGAKPDPATMLGKIAVFLEPAKVDEVARCCVAGVTVARVDFGEKWHEWADFKKDECEKLESRVEPGGAYVLWSPGQTGTQMCLVRLSNPPPVHFPAKITSVESLSGNRYKYGFQEVEKTAALHDGWTNKSGGRSGYAYNLIETVDDPQCVPAKVNETVWIEEVEFTGAGGDKETEYWFQYEEYDQDASSGGSDGSAGSPGGPGPGSSGYIDVVICGGWNRCGQYIVLPQKRINYDSRGNITSIETIASETIPLFECESSGDPPSMPPPPPPDSSDLSESISPSLNLYVTGDLTPDATGKYTYRGTVNGKDFWGRTDNQWAIYWSAALQCWRIWDGVSEQSYWYKLQGDNSPLGYYHGSSWVDGTAYVYTAP